MVMAYLPHRRNRHKKAAGYLHWRVIVTANSGNNSTDLGGREIELRESVGGTSFVAGIAPALNTARVSILAGSLANLTNGNYSDGETIFRLRSGTGPSFPTAYPDGMIFTWTLPAPKMMAQFAYLNASSVRYLAAVSVDHSDNGTVWTNYKNFTFAPTVGWLTAT
jgi:hypothetical protein